MSFKINIAGCQQIAFTSSGSTNSGAVINAKGVVLYATKDCFVAVGAAPTAGATGAANIFVPAQTFLELNTVGNEQSLIAARGSSESGTLYINQLVV